MRIIYNITRTAHYKLYNAIMMCVTPNIKYLIIVTSKSVSLYKSNPLYSIKLNLKMRII